MSFSAGVFTINSAGQPVVTGTVISSTVFNSLTSDLATGLSTCVLKDGTQTMTANIPMGTYILTGLGAGTAAGHSLRYEQLTPSQGTFTMSLTGCTAAVNGTATYSITNGVVTLFIPTLSGTSNTTAATLTGLPAAIRPVTAAAGFAMVFTNNSVLSVTAGRTDVMTDGTANLYTDLGGTGWTASGTKGLTAGATVTYKLT